MFLGSMVQCRTANGSHTLAGVWSRGDPQMERCDLAMRSPQFDQINQSSINGLVLANICRKTHGVAGVLVSTLPKKTHTQKKNTSGDQPTIFKQPKTTKNHQKPSNSNNNGRRAINMQFHARGLKETSTSKWATTQNGSRS